MIQSVVNEAKPKLNANQIMEKLAKEKEVVGIYISAHPLDDFKNELKFCNASVAHFKGDLQKYVGANLVFAGIITEVQHRVSKAGKGWASFFIEDYLDSFEFRIFGEDYLKFKHFLVANSFLFVRTTIQKGWTKSPLFKTALGRNYELHHCQTNNKRLFSRIEMYKEIYDIVKEYPEVLEFHKPAFSISKFIFENGGRDYLLKKNGIVGAFPLWVPSLN